MNPEQASGLPLNGDGQPRPVVAGGGEMGELIRSKPDWESSSLGHPSAWPQSLRTAVSIMLSSRFPMIIFWGDDLSVIYNDAYIPICGAKHPRMLGKTGFEAWGEVWEVIFPMFQSVRRGEATWSEDQFLALRRRGFTEETYLTWSYSPIVDETGNVGGVFTAVQETTTRVLAERRLATLRELNEHVAEAKEIEDACRLSIAALARNVHDVPFAAIYLLEGDRLRRASSSTTDEDVAPLSVALDDGPWNLGELIRTGVSREVTPSQVRLPGGPWPEPGRSAFVAPIAKPGQTTPYGALVAGISPRLLFDDDYASFFKLTSQHIASAVSNAVAYEEERRRAEALAEINRAKNTFFSNVSHEFRTPLTLMLAPIEDMRAEPSEDAAERERIELLHRNALRLLKLVNTLLDFSRIEAGRAEAVYEPTDLSALTADLSSSFRSAIERAGLALIVDCPPLSEPICVDRVMWEKIVLNLLSNAFKFTFDGSIVVRVRELDAAAELTITDTGTGIAEHELPRLFERFHRIEGARSRSHEGSGIGLALVHELVRMQGGDITVTSQESHGTTFCIHIPRGSAHLDTERIRAGRALQSSAAAGAYVEEATRWTIASSAPPPTDAEDASGSRERILIADDNSDMRDYVARLLGERWDIEAVSDGHLALEAIRRSPPDLVLSDVMMPGLDGFALLRAVRSDAELRAIPFLLLSARAGEEAVAEGLNAGADDYLVKPFTARDLLVRVAARLATAKALRQSTEQRLNFYQAFMQAPFTFCIMRGPDLVIEFANDRMLAAWGKSRDVVGLPFERAVPEIKGQPFIDLLHGVLRAGVAHEGRAEQASLPTGPGGTMEDVFYNYVYAPVAGLDGKPEGVFVAGFDVTEQVQARQRIEALASDLSVATDRLQASQSVAGIGIFDWDLPSQRVYWSPELYALMGLEPNAIAATPEAWTEKLHEDDREVGWDAFREATERHEARMEVEVRLRQPDGEARWVRLTTLILYDEASAPRRLLGAIVDVQVLKEAVAATERALAEAERTSRAKDEFLATMSHELRTPLNAIVGWAAMLEKDHSNDAKLQRGLAVIARNAHAQTRIVSDLMDVSRIISGKLQLSMKRVELSAMIYAAADVIRPAADAKGVRLVLDLDPNVGAIIGDADRLQQIVWNLLSNAVRFTPARGRVTILAERSDSTVRIKVQDTGAGIPPEHLPHIFERFRQVDSTTTRAHGGLGLGLAIVRHLTEGHGGTVAASSDGANLGTTFTITLPIHALDTSAAVVEMKAETETSVSAPEAKSAIPLRNVRALIVDDEHDSLELLRLVLEGAGATVTAVTSAREALDEVGPFDILISDIGMPEMDGYDLMRRFRSLPSGSQIPAIALTAYARSEDADRARAAGYQRHMTKPVNASDFLAAITRLLDEPSSA